VITLTSGAILRLLAVGVLLGTLSVASLSVVLADEIAVVDGDVIGLIEAIDAANERGVPTAIILATNGDYVLTSPLPSVSGNVTIEGNGATIRRSDGSGTPEFRIFEVAILAELHLYGVTVSNGQVGAGGGGGIRNSLSGTLKLTNSMVNGNSATSDGGGISNLGWVTLINSSVSGNAARSAGGILNHGDLTLIGSTISDNQAGGYGGGIYNDGRTVTLSGSTVSDNTALQYGGGIYNQYGALTLTNSTVSGNEATTLSGGGVYNKFRSATLVNTTVSDNSAGTEGGGVYNDAQSTGLVLTSTLVAGNRAAVSAPDISGNVTTDNGFNLLGVGDGTDLLDGVNDNQVGTSIEPIDPKLGLLLNNGGQTATMALQDDSPAIGIIPEGINGCGDVLDADQRGIERPQGSHCDIGAFEFEAALDPEPNDPTIAEDCLQSGWQDYGFRNQGLCIQFVKSGKDTR
jgi:hypothetical protein